MKCCEETEEQRQKGQTWGVPNGEVGDKASAPLELEEKAGSCSCLAAEPCTC